MQLKIGSEGAKGRHIGKEMKNDKKLNKLFAVKQPVLHDVSIKL